jgi:cytochrome P450
MASGLLPRGPKSRFLIGHLPEIRHDWLGFITTCAREYGDFVPLRFGPKRAALLAHPDYIEYVLITNNGNFTKGPLQRNNRRLLGNGLINSQGDFWLRQRRLAQPAFHNQRVAAYGDVMVTYAEQLLLTWHDGDVLDIYGAMKLLALKIGAKALFDADVSGEAAEIGAAIDLALERFHARINSRQVLLPDTIPMPSNLAYLRAARRLDEIVEDIIDRRRTSGEDRGDLLFMLLRAQDEDDRAMTEKQLRDEVMTFLLASQETSTNLLSWIWYLLAQHPEVDGRLLTELRAVLGGRAPTVADVPRLKYTEMVVSEAMRLYPPTWAISRETIRECEIGGYLVLPGTILVISQWVLHRDPRYFPDPERFHPDRWSDGLAQRLPRFAYFPFGGGPRLCIAKPFVMIEAVLVLATIAQKFRLTLVPGRLATPAPSMSLRPKDGVHVTLHGR